jgi:hypothetical protein
MESRSNRFRAHAIYCEEAAALADTEVRRRELLDFARQWRQLAEQVEFLDEGIDLQ